MECGYLERLAQLVIVVIQAILVDRDGIDDDAIPVGHVLAHDHQQQFQATPTHGPGGDVEQGQVTLARRDIPGREGKSTVPMNGAAGEVQEMLATIQADLHRRALDFRQAHTHDPKNYAEFKEAVAHGFAYSWWCGDVDCEAQIREETKATTRCIPLDQEPGTGKCIRCGQEAKERAIFGKAY